MGAKSRGAKKRKGNGSSINKRHRKIRKRTRDFDQIQKDYYNNPELPFDEDIRGCGQFKCFACDIFFINLDALQQHEKSKRHKRSVKLMEREKAHTYKDALRAAEIIP